MRNWHFFLLQVPSEEHHAFAQMVQMSVQLKKQYHHSIMKTVDPWTP